MLRHLLLSFLLSFLAFANVPPQITKTQFAKVITESKDDGTTIAYTYGNALLSDGEHSFLADALGSTRGLVDSSETLTDSYAYTPYGELASHDGTSENSFLFTGEQRDAETDNYYLRARYYSPSTTRFLSRDTYDGKLIDPISQNHYLYAGGNPVMYVDPSGHMSMMSMSNAIAITGILAATVSYSIWATSRGDCDRNIWLTVGIYNAQTFLRAELLPTFWLISEALTWQEEKLKNSRYNLHKPRCDRPPREEDYNNKCAYYAALIAHAESCIRAFESWDKAYKPGEHATKIQQFKNTAKNNKKNYKRSCR